MRVAVMAAALVATSACANLMRPAFKSPVVTLREVRVVSLGFTGGQLEVALGVYNPNQYRLDASNLTYRVFVGDTISLAEGSLEPRASVMEGDSTVIKLPVAFTYAGLGAAGRQLFQTGSVNYRVTGQVTVLSTFANYTVPFSATGRYSTTRR